MNKHHRRRARRARAGFTLTELMVVLLILALLIALVTPNIIRYVGRARVQAAEAQMANFASALEMYRLEVGQYPNAAAGLGALISAPSDARNWAGPYLPGGRIPDDPWGNPYVYERASMDCFVIRSYGRDGVAGGTGEDEDIARSAC
ncbi:type II secretion system major pseudopilin GspG [Hyphomonadaceae bacterium ML37]|nr:type II secretion system major pseudopilin GspG [Hyphomonadaceae bacterium ML37]